MKSTWICLAFCLLVGLAGCNREHDRVGDAPRTETASSIPGWKDVTTSGIAVQFPADWKLIDLSKDKFDQAIDTAFGNDPKFTALREQTSAAAKQGMIKLMAFETATIGTGFATNCNVVIQDLPGQETLEQATDEAVKELAPMLVEGTKSKVQYLSLKPGRCAFIRSEFKTPNPSMPVLVSFAYLSVKGSKCVVVTFGAPLKDEAHIQPIANQIMDTFHFTN